MFCRNGGVAVTAAWCRVSVPETRKRCNLQVALFHLNNRFVPLSFKVSVRIIVEFAPLWTSISIAANSFFFFFKDEGAARWLSGSCSSANIFASSSPHIGRAVGLLNGECQVSSYSFLFQTGSR
ncbi:hypothetical protein K443DRAFT_412769 [Laccaria amethystina LaAM-08-1]|uniref:Uncharacterized protein n=1 Tax=Laccaria amethystina LaAM-08-1 TaxID=1095629 RepID=A0A0C9WIK5_9AGAR|nr:hypothetical protein K443DRAFT_412769 [Laccaria amethystina LaAM-08-1]